MPLQPQDLATIVQMRFTRELTLGCCKNPTTNEATPQTTHARVYMQK